MKKILLVILLSYSSISFGQWGNLFKKVVGNIVEKKATNYILKDISVYNPFEGNSSSLDNLSKMLLNKIGVNSEDKTTVAKLNLIFSDDNLLEVKLIKYRGERLSIQQIANNYGVRDIKSIYYNAKGKLNEDKKLFAVAFIGLMTAIGAIDDY